MKWSPSTSGLASWLGVAGGAAAVIGAIYAVVQMAHKDGHSTLELSLATAAFVATATVFLTALGLAVLGARRERRARELGLRHPLARVSSIDPIRVGVRSPAPDYRKLARKYLPRNPADAELDIAVRRAVTTGTKQWFVMVAGQSTVGKSRTLFEALRRRDTGEHPLQLIAPRNTAALQTLLDPTKGVVKIKGPIVLWLNDIERFLNEGMDAADLYRWRESGRRRIVAATYGSGAVAGNDTISTLTENICRISLAETSHDELGSWRSQLSQEEFDGAGRHGLAAYLVAGQLLDEKLELGRHANSIDECNDGVAVTEAAVDWVRCGRTDPIGREELRLLWRAYPTSASHNDDRFKAGLAWALKPVAGKIALLYDDDADRHHDAAEVYRPDRFAVRLVSGRNAAPREEAWAAALHGAPPRQAMSVGITAYKVSRLQDAVAGFTRALVAHPEALPAQYIPIMWAFLVDVHARLGDREQSIAACDEVVKLLADDPDPEERARAGAALIRKATMLQLPGWPDQEAKDKEALAIYDQLIGDYFHRHDSSLRCAAATAIKNKAILIAGPVDFFRDEHRQDALNLWDMLIGDYYRDPDPNAPASLRQDVAQSLLSKGIALGRPGPLGPKDEDDERAAIDVFVYLVGTFRSDPDPEVHNLVQLAIINAAIVLTNKGEQTFKAQEAARAAVALLEHRLSKWAITAGGSHAPDTDEKIAKSLFLKCTIQAFLGSSLVDVRRDLGRIINNYSDSSELLMRRHVASALLADGIACADHGGLAKEDARARFRRVIDDYSGDDDPVLCRIVEKSVVALKEL